MNEFDGIYQGDPIAIGRLFDRYGIELIRSAGYILWNTEEAEDVVQEAFLRLVKTIQKKKMRKVDGSVYAFLKRTTRNLAIDYLRRRDVRRRYAEKEGKMMAPPGSTPLDWVEDKEVVRHFFDVIDQLSDLQRASFILRVLEGESYQSIAELLKITEASVKTHIVRAKAKLRDLMTEYQTEHV
jgi:RNA polymerase sigma-70 factor, ECF subfamily